MEGVEFIDPESTRPVTVWIVVNADTQQLVQVLSGPVVGQAAFRYGCQVPGWVV